ncbi:C-type lectin-like [Trinorchestia longiramus]|nr:C-type lectin-like [Trinorchestia longiramus]
MCVCVLWLHFKSVSPKLLVVEDYEIPKENVTSSMPSNSSCMCYKQCLVQPTCQGATFRHSSSDSVTVVRGLEDTSKTSAICSFSTHKLKTTDLEKSDNIVKKTVSFLRSPQPPCNQAYIKKKFTAVEDMYCLYFSEDVLKWDEAVNECTKLNAQLASLSYDHLYTAVVKYHKEHHGDKDWWVNLSWKDGEWKWGDGTPHSSKVGSGFWALVQPNKSPHDSYPAVMKASEEPYRQEHIRISRVVKRTIKSTEQNKKNSVAAQAKANPKSFYKYVNDRRFKRDTFEPPINPQGSTQTDNISKARILHAYFTSLFTGGD